MKSGDITGVTGVPELTWCYNRNKGFLCFVGNKVKLLLLVFSGGTSASLYMSELMLTTLRME